MTAIVVVPAESIRLRPVEISYDTSASKRHAHWNIRTRAFNKGKLR